MAFLIKNEKSSTYNFKETVNRKVEEQNRETRVKWMLEDSNRTLLHKFK